MTCLPQYLQVEFSDEFLTNDDECHIEIELPYPIHKPLEHSEHDHIKQYDTILKNYYKKFLLTKEHIKPSTIDKMLDQNLTGPSVLVSEGVLDLYNQKTIDMPYISTFNPYYITGLLDCIELNNIKYLLAAQVNQLVLAPVNDLKKEIILNITPALSERIQGIQAISINSFEVQILIIHENELCIVEIQDIDKVAKYKWRKKFKKSILFAQFCSKKQLVGVILSNNIFYLYNITVNERINLGNVDTQNIRRFYLEENKLMLQGPRNLQIINLQSLSGRLLFAPKMNKNDEIINFKVADRLIYLLTKQFLYRIDMDNFEEFEFCTHLMKSCPCYIHFLNKNETCFLILLSQTGECVLFTGHSVINTLPRLVPNINDTLTKCRLNRDTLLIHGLDKRLNRSTGGSKLLWELDCPVLYTVNDLGEIFRQTIFYNKCGNDFEEPIQVLYEWIRKLPSTKSQLRITNVCDATHIKFLMNKPILQFEVARFKKPNKQTGFFLQNYAKQYHTKNLQTLAQSFAAIWEDDDDDNEEMNIIDDVVPKVKSHDKVTNWIQSHDF